MKFYLAVCLLTIAVSTKASQDGLVYAPGHASADYYSYPAYAFEYSVKDPHTGDNKAQWEKRDGDVVKGAYSLVEPDGSLRVVEYSADDKTGFTAIVKKLGPNVHTSHALPIYKAPIPILGYGQGLGLASVGPIAKYEGLSEAPLLSGPKHGAISSQSIEQYIKPIIKPMIKEPLYEPESLYKYRILPPAPLAYVNPIPSNPYGYKAPSVLERIEQYRLNKGSSDWAWRGPYDSRKYY